MINEYFWQLAQVSAKISGVSAKLIYAQWVHETQHFTSESCVEHNNLSGIIQGEPINLSQLDGELWYRHFDSQKNTQTILAATYTAMKRWKLPSNWD